MAAAGMARALPTKKLTKRPAFASGKRRNGSRRRPPETPPVPALEIPGPGVYARKWLRSENSPGDAHGLTTCPRVADATPRSARTAGRKRAGADRALDRRTLLGPCALPRAGRRDPAGGVLLALP